jgi:hypothetical protein
MLDSVEELSNLTWDKPSVIWSREKTGEHGIVLSAQLPDNGEIARIHAAYWKMELRLWWNAWTHGMPVLEVRSWWSKGKKFYVWCVSGSTVSLQATSASYASYSLECFHIVQEMHRRNLAHGNLGEFSFLIGNNGMEMVPPLNRTLFEYSLFKRKVRDRAFFAYALGGKEPMKPLKISKNIVATLAAETLSFYETLYYYQIESGTNFGESQGQVVLRLNRTKPHPQMGNLNRQSAASFYHNILREIEGELNLILNSSPDPFEDEGEMVTVIGEANGDEDCLIAKPSGKTLKLLEGWCRPADYGTMNLITRKNEALFRVSRLRHINRWVNKSDNIDQCSNRELLPASILGNEGIYCVQGPPGTGKTHLAAEVVEKLLEEDPDARILVCAKEHQALSILRNRIVGQLGGNMPSNSLVSTHRNHDLGHLEGTSDRWAREFSRHMLNETTQNSLTQMYSEWRGQPPPILKDLHEDSSQVIFTTTTSWPMNKKRDATDFEPFDFAIIEEAGKCYPSELFPPLGLARFALLIGDQNQLPPFQLEITTEAVDHLSELGSGESDPESLEKLHMLGKVLADNPDWEEVKNWLQPFRKLYSMVPSFMLLEQYRMIPVISDMIGSIFYKTKFINRRSKKESSPAFEITSVDSSSPITWIDTPYAPDFPFAREDLSGHRFNNLEMEIISSILKKIRRTENSNGKLSIITPYNAQVDRLAGNKGLKGILPEKLTEVPSLNPKNSVYTVDSFQGNESDLVIISLVRNNPFGNPNNAWGFVLDPERLNVMLSRARTQLLIVGCSKMIDAYQAYDSMKPLVSVLDYFRKHGRFITWSKNGGMASCLESNSE